MADPMRADVSELTKFVVDSGHVVTLERLNETNAAIARWLAVLEQRHG